MQKPLEREIAEALGVSKAAFSQHYKRRGCPTYSVEAARQWQAQNIDPAQRESSRARAAAKNGLGAARADAGTTPPDGELEPMTYENVRRRKELAEAQRAEIELDRLRGRLGDRDAMTSEFVNHVVSARQLLQAMSARLAPMVAAEEDSKKCGALIDAEVRRVCAELSTHEGPTQ